MATAVDIAVNIITKLDDAGLNQAQGKFGKFQSGLSKASKAATVGLVALGGAAVLAANAAAEDERSQAILANTLENSAGASRTAVAATEEWIAAQSRATGIADDELRPALASLVRATGDVEMSQHALQTAMDVSAATGKPLQAVADAMAKGFGGTTTSLGRLVPGLDKAALASGNMTRIMAALGDKTSGAAAAAADTAAGRWQKFQTQLGEAQESMGAGLLPIMDKLSVVLEKTAVFAQKNTTAFQAIVAVLASLMAVIVVLNAVVKTATILQAAWNLVMAANPAVLIVLAIVAAIALVIIGLTLAWKHSETFRKVVTASFKAVKAAASAVWKFIKAAFTTLWKILQVPVKAYIAYVKFQFNLAKLIITTVFKVIKTVVTNAWTAIKTATKAVRDTINAIWTAIKDKIRTTVESIKSIVTGAWEIIAEKASAAKDKIFDTFEGLVEKIRALFTGIGSAVTDALRGAVDAINKLIRAANKLPGVSIPEITGFAVTPGPALLPSGMVGTPRVRTANPRAGGSVAPVVINVNGALDPDAVARQVRRLLGGHDRRVGGVSIGTGAP